MEIQEGVEQWVEQIKAKRAAEKFWLGPGSLCNSQTVQATADPG